MAGTVSFDPPAIPLARPSESIRVCRYDFASGEFTPLWNIRCLGIQYREGSEPGVARFRYQFDPVNLPSEYPSRIEDVFAFDATSTYKVNQDDRLCVIKDDADGGFTILFDGFAQVPQGDLSPESEQVTFQALGVPVREWDTPIKGALHRDEDDPTTVSDVQTGLPVRFNPDGVGNCVTFGYAGDAPRTYPTFLSSKFVRNPDARSKWTLGGAVRYLVGTGNPDETYVLNPDDWDYFDEALKARVPKDGAEFYDPNDDATYDEEDIICQDFDATGDCWIEAVSKVISPHGFIFQLLLYTDEDGLPFYKYKIMRRDGGNGVKPKTLKLQQPGETLDPGQTNVGSLSLSRDSTDIANAVYLDTAPKEYEASFVLAPGFAIAAGDAATMSDYVEGGANFTTGTNYQKYREFIFDETGEGHWDFPTVATVTTVPTLDEVLGPPASDGEHQYVKRRRPGKFTLFSKDATTGKPYKAQLWISTDYNGLNPPAVWDGTGTWQKVDGGFDLLKDRLGIRINIQDPNDWGIGKGTSSTAPYKLGNVKVVKSLATPTSNCPKFYLRLTTVIEGDQDLNVSAGRRESSPTQYEVKRRLDTRDRFVREVIAPKSQFNTGTEFAFNRDDTDDAQAYCDAYRAAHEVARFAGTATIPRMTLAYSIGDPIKGVVGRDISLLQNAAKDQGEGKQYPYVCAVSWEFDGGQRTVLQLSDRRGEATVRRGT